MGTLFGIGLGAAADSAESAYKTVSGVQQKWAEGDRDDRRVRIAENADKRAAKSAADAAAALEDVKRANRLEAGSSAGAAPATSELAPETPVGTGPSPTASAPPPSPAPASGIGSAVGAPGYDKLPADGSTVTVPPDGSDSMTGATGDARARSATRSATGSVSTDRAPTGVLSATGVARTGAGGEDAAMERLRLDAERTGSAASMNRYREMVKAKADRADKDRAFALESDYKKALTRNARLEGDKKDFEMTGARAAEAARTAYSGIEAEFKGVDDKTGFTDPTLKGRAERSLAALAEADKAIPNRRTMTYKFNEDTGGFDITYKSYTGAETTETVKTVEDIKRLGMIAGMVTKPENYEAYLGTVGRTDFMASIARDKAKLEGAALENALKAERKMTEFNAAFKDKRAMMENPAAIREMAEELTRLAPDKAEYKIKKEVKDENGRIHTVEETKNRWYDMIDRSMPAESVSVPVKGGKPDKDGKAPTETIRWEAAASAIEPRARKLIESGTPEPQIREQMLMALRQQKWPPERAAFIVDKAITEARTPKDKTTMNDPASEPGAASSASGVSAGVIPDAASLGERAGERLGPAAGSAARSAGRLWLKGLGVDIK